MSTQFEKYFNKRKIYGTIALIGRYLAIRASLYFLIIGFPLASAFFLCENNVITIFRE